MINDSVDSTLSFFISFSECFASTFHTEIIWINSCYGDATPATPLCFQARGQLTVAVDKERTFAMKTISVHSVDGDRDK